MKLGDLVIGKTYWYAQVDFTNRWYLRGSHYKPFEIRFEGSISSCQAKFTNVVTGKVFSHEVHIDHLYETKEEAVEYYNQRVYGEIDRCQAEADRIIKRLKKNLI